MSPELAFAQIVENNPQILNNYAAEKGIDLNSMIDANGKPIPENAKKMQDQILSDIETLSQLQQLAAGVNAKSVDIVHVL